LTIKEARLNAGLTQQRMSEVFEIPKRTIENWETGKRNPPAYVEKLVIRELERIAKENNSK
jgi:DNA-binding transcriptional regulator YiaG